MNKFQRWLGRGAAAVVALLLLYCSSLAISSLVFHIDEPRIACKKPVFDFGSCQEFSEVQHEFVIENRGKRRLDIHDVRKSCSCTVVGIRTTVVEPGCTIGVNVSLLLRGRKGKVEHKIVISSNDPTTPHYILSVQGEIK